MTIVLYDLVSTLPHKAFAPNTWKTRFCLNYKGLSYRTAWIDLDRAAIKAGVYDKLGLAPLPSPDGSPAYLLPVIHDTATGVSVADSFAIAEYLERTYPAAQRLFPHNTAALQSLVDGATFDGVIQSVLRFTVLDRYLVLRPVGKDYFRRTREAEFGMPLEDIAPKGNDAVAEWAKVEAAFGAIAAWYAKSEGPFILGPTVSWADFAVACWVMTARSIWGEESQKWKEFAWWHGGLCAKIIDDLKEYQKID
ncbi:hypothetical protein HYPSUDRAFT_211357 [Hypholoma sublateritium FD-334 SS-4]|uniref:GST N-terminal domain-containing protein n=1 Tax=Hypholoma sublateritium (strain FD-334 SS-4) TaxID=945553 RepID=A0A0D2QD18_HYPSF|nr:hypothetical protein HYPSUDRAFT_211357 [Hypholoma sublateritium FD-334 SS-4]